MTETRKRLYPTMAELREEQAWMARLETTGGYPVICPDIFGQRHLGSADTLRGRAVRAFAWLMERWPY